MKLGRVRIKHHYIVDLENTEMVEEAVECMHEDLCDAIKDGVLASWISTEADPSATEADIPEFLKDEVAYGP